MTKVIYVTIAAGFHFHDGGVCGGAYPILKLRKKERKKERINLYYSPE